MADLPSRLHRLFFGTVFRKLLIGLFITSSIPVIILGALLLRFSGKASAQGEAIPVDAVAAILGRQALFLALVMVASLVMLAFYYHLIITSPLKQLFRSAERLKERNFAVKTFLHTGDEFEQPARTLNKSVDALWAAEKERKVLDKAKTEFLSITGHELRSPMTAIMAQMQMLHAGYFGVLNRKQQESVAMTLRNVKRLDRILVDLLDLSMLESGKVRFSLATTSLAPHITQLVDDFRHDAKRKGIRLTLHLGRLPVMRVDPDRVMQVLRNLVQNAIKFTQDKGSVLVSASLTGKEVRISVKDTGIGIAAEHQHKIFEAFYQEEETIFRTYAGVGLGLTICKGLVEAQKGRIWVESEKGKGSTFTFTIPLKPARETVPITLMLAIPENEAEELKGLFTEFLGERGQREFAKLKDEGMTTDNFIRMLQGYLDWNLLRKQALKEFRDRGTAILEKIKRQDDDRIHQKKED